MPRILMMLPLLLATLLLRGLVPAGWMPVDSAGGVVMTLCGSAGTVTIDPGHAPAMPQGDAPCAFAGLAPLFTADPPVLAAPVAALLVIVVAFIPRALRIPPAPRLRPPTRAPPVSLAA